MVIANDLLDLTVLSRGEKCRFDLVDATGRVLGEVHPAWAPKVENDGNRQIKRRLTGFKLAADESASVNPLSDRVAPKWVLSDGTEWPMGVFAWADAVSKRYSYGTQLQGSLSDLGIALAQKIGATLAFEDGALASDAINAVFAAAGFYNAVVAVSTFTLKSPTAYPAGRGGTTYAKILDDLCKKAGYYPYYFDNDGVPTVRTIDSSIADITSGLVYADGGRIASGSITESNDLLSAPNRFLVIDTSATTGNVSFAFDIPEDAPHSYARRGFYITETIEAPGVGDASQAEAVARAYYQSTVMAYETVTFSSPVDPRHDTFDVITYRGTNYLETSWSITCSAGAPMTHTAVRSYL